MNTNLKLLLIAVLVASPMSFAKGNPEQRKERAAQIQEKFGITEEQAAEMRRIRANGGTREEARGVLTDEQRQEMEGWARDHPEAGQRARSRREGATAAGADSGS